VARAWILEEIEDAAPDDFVRARSTELLSDRLHWEVHRLESVAGKRLYGKIIHGLGNSSTKRLKWILRPSRALQVWRVAKRFERHGLRCAPVALAARGGSRFAPVDVLITVEAPGVSLYQRLLHDPPEVALESCRVAGDALAKLHRAGILHGDATHSNVLVAWEGSDGGCPQVVWIDNDRTRAWPVLPAALARRNLAQMSFRVRHWGPHALRALVDGYADAQGLSEAQRRRLRRKLARSLRARRALFRERGLPLVRTPSTRLTPTRGASEASRPADIRASG